MVQWRAIKDWSEYQVSDQGEVVSVKRQIIMRNGAKRTINPKPLKLKADNRGYLFVKLVIGTASKTVYIHKLVAQTYLNLDKNLRSPVVKHIDGDKSNNSVENLKIISTTNTAEGCPGVYWHSQGCKWQVRATLNGKKVSLGMFDAKENAYTAYLEVMHAQPIKVIIAGGRDYSDYNTLRDFCDSKLSKVRRTASINIISGKATGADALGERYAKENSMPIIPFPADWDTHGKAAGPIRNKQMAEHADYLIAFYDGKSPGTGNMIKEAERAGLKIAIKNI